MSFSMLAVATQLEDRLRGFALSADAYLVGPLEILDALAHGITESWFCGFAGRPEY